MTFHAFPKDDNRRKEWKLKMRRQDEKFKSNASLYCCAEHFNSDDYKGSLTGLRRDLKRDAMPSKFAWTKVDGQSSIERSRRPENRSLNKDKLETKDTEIEINQDESHLMPCRCSASL